MARSLLIHTTARNCRLVNAAAVPGLFVPKCCERFGRFLPVGADRPHGGRIASHGQPVARACLDWVLAEMHNAPAATLFWSHGLEVLVQARGLSARPVAREYPIVALVGTLALNLIAVDKQTQCRRRQEVPERLLVNGRIATNERHVTRRTCAAPVPAGGSGGCWLIDSLRAAAWVSGRLGAVVLSRPCLWRLMCPVESRAQTATISLRLVKPPARAVSLGYVLERRAPGLCGSVMGSRSVCADLRPGYPCSLRHLDRNSDRRLGIDLNATEPDLFPVLSWQINCNARKDVASMPPSRLCIS